MAILEKIMQIPTFGKFVLEKLKKNAFNSFQTPLETALEKQTQLLQRKFERMEKTKIGAKIGIQKGSNLEKLPITEYNFYAPFYKNPAPSSFMYPLEDYAKIKTSGTTGESKWFLIPYKAMRTALKETALPVIFALFHDGEKITIEYGDTMYLNLGPAPFLSGSMFNMGTKEKRASFLRLVPNINLSYKEKVDYFILNHDTIDAAWIMASTLITQVIPTLNKSIKLKGLMLIDDLVARAYKNDIVKFAGTTPKTCYASSETIAPTIPSVQHSMGFIFDPRRGVFEFAELEKNHSENEIVGLNEVKVGKIYRLIYTDLIGELTRYDTANAFKCIAKGDNIIRSDYPVFEYSARLDKVISIMNFTRIDEKELIGTFRIVGVRFMDFTARLEMEGGHEYLHLYVEPIGKTTKDVEKKIHDQLYAANQDYKMLVNSFEYNPIRVEFLPEGTFSEYLARKGGAYPKVPRIDMNDEEFEMLKSMVKR